jgi:rhamnulokinase
MKPAKHFVAVDLGASSGRVVSGNWDGHRFTMEELHRFPNGPAYVFGSMYWDVLRLWSGIKEGLAKFALKYGTSPDGISVDGWGVDFALLDGPGMLIGNPHHYRDPRTNGIPEKVFRRITAEDIFQRTGVQSLQINTLFQLASMVESADCRLSAAKRLLMMPDLFHYWLSGEQGVEYTIASTSQMLHCRERGWNFELAKELGIPAEILGPIIPPATVLANLRSEVGRECGFDGPVPVIAGAAHDTASAVAAVPGLDRQSVFISSGTWSLMGVAVPEPITSREAFSRNFTNEGGARGDRLLMRNLNGLWLLQECVRHWESEGRNHNWETLIERARLAPPLRSFVDPDAHDFLAAPDMPSAIRGYCQRTAQAEPQDEGAMARCCLESLSLKYREVLEDLESLLKRRFEIIRVVGGGSRNQLLCQLTADCCQRPVVSGPAEASSLGNVMLQAVATGSLNSIDEGRQSIAGSCELAIFEPSRDESFSEAYERVRSAKASATALAP